MPSKQLLQTRQRYPLELKIAMTKARIRQWYEHWQGDVYISFSGGKDSTVLLHIARQMYPETEAVFVDTGLEFPEIRDFVKTINNVTWLRPKMNFKQVVEEYGYPVISKRNASSIHKLTTQNLSDKFRNYLLNGDERGKTGSLPKQWHYLLEAPFKISAQCCNVMKKRPLHKFLRESNKYPIIATMTEESSLRQQNWLLNGCNAFDNKTPISQPMSFWTEQDILRYITNNHLDYAAVYGEIVPKSDFAGQMVIDTEMTDLTLTGCKRTGCMFCMFGCHLEKEPNRFQRMKITHPKQYEYCINGGEYVNGVWQPNSKGLGCGKVMDFIGVDYR